MLACRLSRNSVGSEHQPARRVRHSAAVRSVGSDCVGDLRRMVIGAWETGESGEGNRELETGIGRRLTSILSVSFGLFALGVPVVWLVVGMDHSAANDIPETAPELRSPVAADPTMSAVETGTGSPPPLASTTSARVPDSTSPPPTTGSASGFSAESLPTTTTTTTTSPTTTTTGAPSTTTSSIQVPSPTPVVRERRSFTIAATGDLLIHRAIVQTARTADGWDFTPLFSQVAPILRAADLAVCHVETPMSPDNRRISSYPLFSVPNQLADAIAYAGYDTCSLASNHSTDTGVRGVTGTIEALDRVEVAHAGMARTPQERATINLLEVNGATVAHLSYTYGFNNGPLRTEQEYMANVINEETILDEAGRARAAGADFVILSLHWGTEYRRMPDPYQTDLGPHLLSSPDIDLILGHHAHVVQPVELIGDKYLVYGMGNFLSNQSPRWEEGRSGTQDGVILQFTVTEDPTTGRWSVTSISHTPTRVNLVTFEIVNALNPKGEHNAAVLARSAGDTAEALAALGTTIRAIRGPAPHANEWPGHPFDEHTESHLPDQYAAPRYQHRQERG